MLEAIGSELPQVLRDLVVAGLCYVAFKLTRDYARTHGSLRAAWRGLAWAAGLGLLVAALKGAGTCVGGDPLFGGCTDTAGSFEPSMTSRLTTAFYWFALLGVPVAIGASDWRARMGIGRNKA